MHSPGNAVYLIEEIEVNTSRGYLRRDQQEMYLRQKTLQVLVYLLEHRERLVTKEELMERVWKDTAVTDDVLVQCVMDIRKALGDDSRDPRFVRTIPKAGYRFIGPVEVRQPAAATIVETEETTSVELDYEEESPDALPANRQPSETLACGNAGTFDCLQTRPLFGDRICAHGGNGPCFWTSPKVVPLQLALARSSFAPNRRKETAGSDVVREPIPN